LNFRKGQADGGMAMSEAGAGAANISGSVGRGGVNRSSDVITVQTLLNSNAGAGLKADGGCGPKTLQAILNFQKGFLPNPDGRIDPGGTSWRRLKGIASNEPKLIQLPQMCGLGYYSYSTEDRQFGTEVTIQTILDVGRSFRFNMPAVEIGIGDMSFALGGHMSPHTTHQDGKQVDIRPLRTDGMRLPCAYQNSVYSREYTTLLAKSFLAHRNVRQILFNDSKIPGVHYFQGHDNHLHVIMYK
jgi:peptidoglycan hydrolase-like protein with peptidoglycan-binding domain